MKIPVYLEQSLKMIDPWLDHKRFFSRMSGLAVGIVYQDQIVFRQGYGLANLETKEKVTAETCFRIASISKFFTATAIMQLSEQGKLKLSDKVSKHLPWFKSGKDKSLEKITIKQLLTHFSGINRDGDKPQWTSNEFPLLADIKAQTKAGLHIFDPGEKFKYSNMGFTILGQVVAAVSGKRYEDFIQENIFNKLEMPRTATDYSENFAGKLAVGYSRDIPGRTRRPYPHINTAAMASATGFVSNTTDLCKFLSAQFPGNDLLLSDKSKQEMQQVRHLRKANEDGYGYGLRIWFLEKGLKISGHSGSFIGYQSRIAFDPKQEIGVVVLTNDQDTVPGLFVNGIFRTIKFFKDNSKKFRPTKISFKKFEGRFSSRWADIEFVDLGNHLAGFELGEDTPTQNVYELEYLKDNEFKILDCNDFDFIGEKIRFEVGKTGQIEKVFFTAEPLTKVGSNEEIG